ncbi:hypothetical protein GMOD_00001460 [Pyrenophora seminiperda CCB06]|uniref:Uncharacterized protein n=1 Tax=Pyrenophora seminiperda CCB06 TaxID=1302712 RepID=A0A3M7LZ47_9PLEO|nr:hypothetical protein GMOD_00001460 [Pyrenophora seminiperda CCB06]
MCEALQRRLSLIHLLQVLKKGSMRKTELIHIHHILFYFSLLTKTCQLRSLSVVSTSTMTQLPEISKTVSQPEGPGPSFLNLLPELRNIVYENCLIIPGWIHVTKVNPDEYDEYGVVGFEYPFVLLQTCRTIYHEGVGIYYSQNKFLFGQPRINGPYPDNTWVYPTPLPARFATDSPSRLQYLQHVVIYCYSERINLAPYAKICWARKDQKCIFEFASVDWYAVTDRNMNESFWQIVKDDTLGIRQYHRQILAIRWGDDRISWELPYENPWRVAIRFGTHSETWELKFHSEDEGKTYKRLENPRKPQLSHGHLPQPFEESVFEKVLCSEPIEIDVQRNKFVGNIPDISLLFVSKAVRLKAQQIFWQRNTFTYKLTLEPTPVDKTTPLYPLAAAPCIYIPGHTHSGVVGNLWTELFSRQIYDDYEYRRITLEFNLRYDSAMTLADVRIDVRELIRITSHITGRNFFLRFKVSSTKLPSTEAIEAKYNVLAGELQEMSGLRHGKSWVFTGNLSSYLGYLMYVVTRIPEMERDEHTRGV